MKKLTAGIVVALLAVSLVLGGCSSNSGGGTASTGPKYKIGLVFDIGGRGDQSFNDSAYNGLVQIAKDYKGYIKDDPDNVNYGTDVELKYLEPKQGGQDREELLRTLAEDGYQLIFAVGFMFTDPVVNVAKDFPNTKFALIDGTIDGLTATSNIVCLDFKANESSFLVGAIAGYKTKTNKVGFVGGMQSPLIESFEAGYKAGAMYVNANLRKTGNILSQYIGTTGDAFKDPAKGKEIASTFYSQGADVVYHASGASGAGVFQAAYEAYKAGKDVWAIGVDSDQGLIYKSSKSAQDQAIGDRILTSALKRVDNSVYETARDFMNGSLQGGVMNFGLKENGVGYALNDYNKALLQDVQAKVDELQQKIINGEIVVPASNAELANFKLP
jgi:basic membrane protein A